MLERSVLERLRALIPLHSSILCALSGGADSVAMTLALRSLRETADSNSVACAHFNHGLRGEDADADEKFCKQLCDGLGIPIYTGKINGISGGEAEYRRLRYDFLIKTAFERNISYIATAHTADDNAETLLLNLTRGTGLDGLTGIPAIRHAHSGIYIIRPLLGVTRTDVLEFLQKSGQDYRDDASNHTDAYRRNRIRRNIIPELRKENPKLPETLSHTAELLKYDREYLEEQANLARKAISTSANTVSAQKLLSLPKALSARIVRQMCESVNGGTLDLSSKHIEAVMSLCSADPSASANLPRGLTARRVYGELRVEKSGSEITFKPVKIAFEQTVFLDGLDLKASWTEKPKKVNNLVYSFSIKSDTIKDSLTIRPRLSGDSIRLAGRGHSKTLHRLFIDSKVPKHERMGIPVLADEAGIVAVGGFGVDERCLPKGNDPRTILQIYRDSEG